MKNHLLLILFIVLAFAAGVFSYLKITRHSRPNFDRPHNPIPMQKPDPLLDTSWEWTGYRDVKNMGDAISPNLNKSFILTFSFNDEMTSTTDCNGLSGKYVVEKNSIKISEMLSTQMYCENSRESEYTQWLAQAETYRINNSTLIITLADHTGELYFTRRAKMAPIAQ